MKSLHKVSSRVDFQVSIITACITLCSTVLLSWYLQAVTYKAAQTTLVHRARAIHASTEKILDPTTFYTLNVAEDMHKVEYVDSKLSLEYVKDITGVMYLYTAKRNENGEFIYVIDGLDESLDFRRPGDLIEPEVYAQMERALKNEEVLPDKILETSWGNIFISYFPYHDPFTKEIVGVIGIEFEASELHDAYEQLRIVSAIACLAFCFISAFVSFRLFRRLSNPNFKDLATTDEATMLRNRNAFEMDLHNISARELHERIAIVVVDINGLKFVNDTFGHNFGDAYIKLVADILREFETDEIRIYRIGGDEFISIIRDVNIIFLQDYVTNIKNRLAEQRDLPTIPTSISCGYALYDEYLDKDSLRSTIVRADQAMYEQKKEHYSKMNSRNNDSLDIDVFRL